MISLDNVHLHLRTTEVLRNQILETKWHPQSAKNYFPLYRSEFKKPS